MLKKPLIALAALTAAGCGGDGAPPTGPAPENDTLPGAWALRVIEGKTTDHGYPFQGARFIHFSGSTQVLLVQSGDDFRGVEVELLEATENSAVIDGDPFLYTIDSGVLTLTEVGEDDVIVADRADDAPTAEEWVRSVAVVASIDAPVDADNDLAWDGTSLLMGNGRGPTIAVIDPVTRSVTRTIPSTQHGKSIAYHAGELWTSNNGSTRVRRIDDVTGAVQFTTVALGAWIQGMASDGTHLWLASNNDDILIQYDPTGDVAVQSVPYENLQPDGMTYAAGFLDLVEENAVQKIDAATLEVVDAFRVAGRDVRGIAHDGSSFWVLTRDALDPQERRIDQLAP